MSLKTLSVGDPIPADGEFELLREGKVFAVVHHPRIEGYWMAFWPPKDWREAGMKKFAKRASAVRWVMKKL